MFSRELEKVERCQLAWFYRLLGAALAVRLMTDVHAGIWYVHTGEFFPWRHLPSLPLYPPAVLLLEWLALAVAGIGLMSGRALRASLRLGLVATLMGLSQRYANQNVLLFLVVGFANLSVADPHELLIHTRYFPNFALIRIQLLLVYGFSILNKILHGFLTGDVLQALFGLGERLSQVGAWSVVLAEGLIPGLLCWGKSRWGLLVAVLVHCAFGVAIPGVWPFTLVMLAMVVLWVHGLGGGGAEPGGGGGGESTLGAGAR